MIILFFNFLYESVCGQLATTNTIHTPAGNLQETKNVQGNLFASISGALSVCQGTITMNYVK